MSKLVVERLLRALSVDSSTEITEESIEEGREFIGDDTTRFCDDSG